MNRVYQIRIFLSMFGTTSIRYSLLTMVYYKVVVFHMSDDKIEYALQIGPMGLQKGNGTCTLGTLNET